MTKGHHNEGTTKMNLDTSNATVRVHDPKNPFNPSERITFLTWNLEVEGIEVEVNVTQEDLDQGFGSGGCDKIWDWNVKARFGGDGYAKSARGVKSAVTRAIKHVLMMRKN